MLKDKCKFCGTLHPQCFRVCFSRETNTSLLTALFTSSGRYANGCRCVVAFLWWWFFFFFVDFVWVV